MASPAWLLRTVHAWDQLRLAWLRARNPNLEIHPTAAAALSLARFVVAPGGRVRIGAGVVTERLRGRLHFHVEPGGLVDIGDGTWLRTEVGEIHLVAFAGATLRLGRQCLINGAHLSAKSELRMGFKSMAGPGARIFDADQHDFDAERPERREPVHIGDHVWIASDVTILKGVTVGDHAIVGTRSVVTRDVAPHTVVAGAPARELGKVGDRSQAS